ncbi:MAG: T9SS type A sorting domain-containing protein [bacterium]|nr:MAG: T9SS type A sorting domain-containing protein [bacterium]
MRLWIACIILLIIKGLSGQEIDRERVLELARTRQLHIHTEQEILANNIYNQTYSRVLGSSDYDQIYYDLNFTLSYSPENMKAVVTGYFKSKVNGLSQITLNFDSREDHPPYWADMTVSGNISGWDHSNWILQVQLDRLYNSGEIFSITVEFSGVPRSSGLKGFWFNNGGVFTLSEPYAAQTWWPCKDDPADKLDSVRISATVPEYQRVASNGLLISETTNSNNTKTYTWFEKYPIATYLVSLAIDNYTVISDSFEYSPGQFMPIVYYIYPSQVSTAVEAFDLLPEMLEIYSQLFGLYPFIEEKYGHAVFPWGGGMEHQTCTSIGNVSTTWETLYAHELAHQWYGDLVTCHDWHHIWLNEGFASYAEALWMESYYGSEAFHSYVNSTLTKFNFNGIFTEPVYRYDISNPWNIFSGTVYDKGMWVLHMLRHVVGDSIFFQIMHDYPNDMDFVFGHATTEQFRDFCEQVSGSELDWFFHQWIYEAYYPIYEWGYTHYIQGSQNVLRIVVKQKHSSSEFSYIYKMPIDLIVEYTDLTRDTLVIWDSLEVQSFNIPVAGIPQTVFFDPDNWILKKDTQVPISFIESPIDLTSTFMLYQNYPNPFNGATVIPFALDSSGWIVLEIYDATGRKVRTLADDYFTQGDLIRWDGRDDHAKIVASGIYIYRIRFQNQIISRKMLFIR